MMINNSYVGSRHMLFHYSLYFFITFREFTLCTSLARVLLSTALACSAAHVLTLPEMVALMTVSGSFTIVAITGAVLPSQSNHYQLTNISLSPAIS